ncbi:MAG TPA: DEAD/DEAH box helicase [Sedimentisphaerales bacterium]|nr:DEAD/DEAH box helicase [Sedimentisphaerales bacterium]
MELFKHQKHAIELCKAKNIALFHSCGTGKTLTALNVIKYWQQAGSGPALVVCPLSIIDAAWINDCKKFTPELDIVSLWSPKPADRKKRLIEHHDIYVCNFETFKSLFAEIQAKQFGTIIVDESSKMKSPSSQTTRALLALAGIKTRGKGGIAFPVNHIIRHRYVLSGTPAPNKEDEYWSQIKFVTGPGNAVFSDNYYAFRSRYFYAVPLGMTGVSIWKFRASNKQEFMDTMTQVANVVRKQDAVDLPDQTHEIRVVTLSKPEQAAYNELKEELVLQFENESVLATSAIVETMKLRQLTSGFLYGEETHQIGTSKLDELKALLDEIGDNQVIIWANFKHEIATLLKELPNSEAIWSGTPDRDSVIKNFQQGKTKYLIANPASAAHGLTFVNCSYAVYYSQNYSYELQKQSEDRIHRIGQKWPCTYYHLIAKGTIDEVIYKVVSKKADLSTEVLNFLRGNVKHVNQYQTA